MELVKVYILYTTPFNPLKFQRKKSVKTIHSFYTLYTISV